MEKDTNQPEQNRKDIQVYETVSVFIKDKYGVYLYRRSEKICKAYFLLTQHIQDSESIKTKLRERALELSSKTLNLVGSLNKSEDLSRLIVLEALSLVSMSDIASSSHLISPSNYALVVKQIEIFVTEVENYCKSMSYSSQAIPSTLFNIDAFVSDDQGRLDAAGRQGYMTPEVSFIKDTVVKTETHSSHIESSHAFKNPQAAKRSDAPVSSSIPKKNTESSVASSASNKPEKIAADISSDKSSDGAKNERQTLILDTIRLKGELSIKDLTDVIKGCSEKTIQRELIALVSSGALLKTGERRWSRYSLAK